MFSFYLITLWVIGLCGLYSSRFATTMVAGESCSSPLSSVEMMEAKSVAAHRMMRATPTSSSPSKPKINTLNDIVTATGYSERIPMRTGGVGACGGKGLKKLCDCTSSSAAAVEDEIPREFAPYVKPLTRSLKLGQQQYPGDLRSPSKYATSVKGSWLHYSQEVVVDFVVPRLSEVGLLVTDAAFEAHVIQERRSRIYKEQFFKLHLPLPAGITPDNDALLDYFLEQLILVNLTVKVSPQYLRATGMQRSRFVADNAEVFRGSNGVVVPVRQNQLWFLDFHVDWIVRHVVPTCVTVIPNGFGIGVSDTGNTIMLSPGEAFIRFLFVRNPHPTEPLRIVGYSVDRRVPIEIFLVDQLGDVNSDAWTFLPNQITPLTLGFLSVVAPETHQDQTFQCVADLSTTRGSFTILLTFAVAGDTYSTYNLGFMALPPPNIKLVANRVYTGKMVPASWVNSSSVVPRHIGHNDLLLFPGGTSLLQRFQRRGKIHRLRITFPSASCDLSQEICDPATMFAEPFRIIDAQVRVKPPLDDISVNPRKGFSQPVGATEKRSSSSLTRLFNLLRRHELSLPQGVSAALTYLSQFGYNYVNHSSAEENADQSFLLATESLVSQLMGVTKDFTGVPRNVSTAATLLAFLKKHLQEAKQPDSPMYTPTGEVHFYDDVLRSEEADWDSLEDIISGRVDPGPPAAPYTDYYCPSLQSERGGSDENTDTRGRPIHLPCVSVTPFYDQIVHVPKHTTELPNVPVAEVYINTTACGEVMAALGITDSLPIDAEVAIEGRYDSSSENEDAANLNRKTLYVRVTGSVSYGGLQLATLLKHSESIPQDGDVVEKPLERENKDASNHLYLRRVLVDVLPTTAAIRRGGAVGLDDMFVAPHTSQERVKNYISSNTASSTSATPLVPESLSVPPPDNNTTSNNIAPTIKHRTPVLVASLSNKQRTIKTYDDFSPNTKTVAQYCAEEKKIRPKGTLTVLDDLYSVLLHIRAGYSFWVKNQDGSPTELDESTSIVKTTSRVELLGLSSSVNSAMLSDVAGLAPVFLSPELEVIRKLTMMNETAHNVTHWLDQLVALEHSIRQSSLYKNLLSKEKHGEERQVVDMVSLVRAKSESESSNESPRLQQRTERTKEDEPLPTFAYDATLPPLSAETMTIVFQKHDQCEHVEKDADRIKVVVAIHPFLAVLRDPPRMPSLSEALAPPVTSEADYQRLLYSQEKELYQQMFAADAAARTTRSWKKSKKSTVTGNVEEEEGKYEHLPFVHPRARPYFTAQYHKNILVRRLQELDLGVIIVGEEDAPNPREMTHYRNLGILSYIGPDVKQWRENSDTGSKKIASNHDKNRWLQLSRVATQDIRLLYQLRSGATSAATPYLAAFKKEKFPVVLFPSAHRRTYRFHPVVMSEAVVRLVNPYRSHPIRLLEATVGERVPYNMSNSSSEDDVDTGLSLEYKLVPAAMNRYGRAFRVLTKMDGKKYRPNTVQEHNEFGLHPEEIIAQANTNTEIANEADTEETGIAIEVPPGESIDIYVQYVQYIDLNAKSTETATHCIIPPSLSRRKSPECSRLTGFAEGQEGQSDIGQYHLRIAARLVDTAKEFLWSEENDLRMNDGNASHLTPTSMDMLIPVSFTAATYMHFDFVTQKTGKPIEFLWSRRQLQKEETSSSSSSSSSETSDDAESSPLFISGDVRATINSSVACVLQPSAAMVGHDPRHPSPAFLEGGPHIQLIPSSSIIKPRTTKGGRPSMRSPSSKSAVPRYNYNALINMDVLTLLAADEKQNDESVVLGGDEVPGVLEPPHPAFEFRTRVLDVEDSQGTVMRRAAIAVPAGYHSNVYLGTVHFYPTMFITKHKAQERSQMLARIKDPRMTSNSNGIGYFDFTRYLLSEWNRNDADIAWYYSTKEESQVVQMSHECYSLGDSFPLLGPPAFLPLASDRSLYQGYVGAHTHVLTQSNPFVYEETEDELELLLSTIVTPVPETFFDNFVVPQVSLRGSAASMAATLLNAALQREREQHHTGAAVDYPTPTHTPSEFLSFHTIHRNEVELFSRRAQQSKVAEHALLRLRLITPLKDSSGTVSLPLRGECGMPLFLRHQIDFGIVPLQDSDSNPVVTTPSTHKALRMMYVPVTNSEDTPLKVQLMLLSRVIHGSDNDLLSSSLREQLFETVRIAYVYNPPSFNPDNADDADDEEADELLQTKAILDKKVRIPFSAWRNPSTAFRLGNNGGSYTTVIPPRTTVQLGPIYYDPSDLAARIRRYGASNSGTEQGPPPPDYDVLVLRNNNTGIDVTLVTAQPGLPTLGIEAMSNVAIAVGLLVPFRQEGVAAYDRHLMCLSNSTFSSGCSCCGLGLLTEEAAEERTRYREKEVASRLSGSSSVAKVTEINADSSLEYLRADIDIGISRSEIMAFLPIPSSVSAPETTEEAFNGGLGWLLRRLHFLVDKPDGYEGEVERLEVVDTVVSHLPPIAAQNYGAPSEPSLYEILYFLFEWLTGWGGSAASAIEGLASASAEAFETMRLQQLKHVTIGDALSNSKKTADGNATALMVLNAMDNISRVMMKRASKSVTHTVLSLPYQQYRGAYPSLEGKPNRVALRYLTSLLSFRRETWSSVRPRSLVPGEYLPGEQHDFAKYNPILARSPMKFLKRVRLHNKGAVPLRIVSVKVLDANQQETRNVIYNIFPRLNGSVTDSVSHKLHAHSDDFQRLVDQSNDMVKTKEPRLVRYCPSLFMPKETYSFVETTLAVRRTFERIGRFLQSTNNYVEDVLLPASAIPVAHVTQLTFAAVTSEYLSMLEEMEEDLRKSNKTNVTDYKEKEGEWRDYVEQACDMHRAMMSLPAANALRISPHNHQDVLIEIVPQHRLLYRQHHTVLKVEFVACPAGDNDCKVTQRYSTMTFPITVRADLPENPSPVEQTNGDVFTSTFELDEDLCQIHCMLPPQSGITAPTRQEFNSIGVRHIKTVYSGSAEQQRHHTAKRISHYTTDAKSSRLVGTSASRGAATVEVMIIPIRHWTVTAALFSLFVPYIVSAFTAYMVYFLFVRVIRGSVAHLPNEAELKTAERRRAELKAENYRNAVQQFMSSLSPEQAQEWLTSQLGPNYDCAKFFAGDEEAIAMAIKRIKKNQKRQHSRMSSEQLLATLTQDTEQHVPVPSVPPVQSGPVVPPVVPVSLPVEVPPVVPNYTMDYPLPAVAPVVTGEGVSLEQLQQQQSQPQIPEPSQPVALPSPPPKLATPSSKKKKKSKGTYRARLALLQLSIPPSIPPSIPVSHKDSNENMTSVNNDKTAVTEAPAELVKDYSLVPATSTETETTSTAEVSGVEQYAKEKEKGKEITGVHGSVATDKTTIDNDNAEEQALDEEKPEIMPLGENKHERENETLAAQREELPNNNNNSVITEVESGNKNSGRSDSRRRRRRAGRKSSGSVSAADLESPAEENGSLSTTPKKHSTLPKTRKAHSRMGSVSNDNNNKTENTETSSVVPPSPEKLEETSSSHKDINNYKKSGEDKNNNNKIIKNNNNNRKNNNNRPNKIKSNNNNDENNNNGMSAYNTDDNKSLSSSGVAAAGNNKNINNNLVFAKYNNINNNNNSNINNNSTVNNDNNNTSNSNLSSTDRSSNSISNNPLHTPTKTQQGALVNNYAQVQQARAQAQQIQRQSLFSPTPHHHPHLQQLQQLHPPHTTTAAAAAAYYTAPINALNSQYAAGLVPTYLYPQHVAALQQQYLQQQGGVFRQWAAAATQQPQQQQQPPPQQAAYHFTTVAGGVEYYAPQPTAQNLPGPASLGQQQWQPQLWQQLYKQQQQQQLQQQQQQLQSLLQQQQQYVPQQQQQFNISLLNTRADSQSSPPTTITSTGELSPGYTYPPPPQEHNNNNNNNNNYINEDEPYHENSAGTIGSGRFDTHSAQQAVGGFNVFRGRNLTDVGAPGPGVGIRGPVDSRQSDLHRRMLAAAAEASSDDDDE